jgi:hypothetical protein
LKGETISAHEVGYLKRILKLDGLRLKELNGAKDEFPTAATAQNLRNFAKLIPMPQPAPV